jgi:hypothetical protein
MPDTLSGSTTNGVIRGLAAAGGGAAAVGSHDDVIQILGALVTLSSIVWSVLEKRRARQAWVESGPQGPITAPPPPAPPRTLPFPALLLGVGLLSLTGCVRLHVYDDSAKRGFTVWAPAFPWADTATALAKLKAEVKTNGVAVNAAGFERTSETSTNFFNGVADVAGSITREAVGAALKTVAPK